ncbi:MAG: aminopeptidase [Candidatus Aenigmatarchaeota archaeon]
MISKAQMQRIARNIIRKSMYVKEKEYVVISSGSTSVKFAEMLAYEAAIIGANPSLRYASDELVLKIYKDTKLKYLKRIPKFSRFFAKNVDVEIHLDDSNPYIEKQLPQDKIMSRVKAFKPIRDIRNRRVVKKTIKSVLLGYPTKENAKAMGVSFKKLNDIFWKTLGTDPLKLFEYNKKIIRKLKNADKIHIEGERTDLKFSVKGRRPVNGCGLWKNGRSGFLNLPAGEIYYCPIETSANGEIYFDLPCMWHFGKQVKGVWFKFKNGKVVDYKVEKGLKNFEDVLKNATGDKYRIAELGIGTNPNAKPTGGMTIVDEKIKGTIHIAIGDNKGFGGKNDATMHWDFFKDMKNGKMFVDGKLFMKNGKIL